MGRMSKEEEMNKWDWIVLALMGSAILLAGYSAGYLTAVVP